MELGAAFFIRAVFLALLASFYVFANAVQQNHQSNGGEKLARAVYRRLDRLLSTFEADVEHLNPDGIFGILHGQAAFMKTLNALSEEPTSCWRIVENLNRRTQNVINSAKEREKLIENTYAKRFKILTEDKLKFLTLDRTPRHVDSSYLLLGVNVHTYMNDLDTYNEKAGDDCITRLLGTYPGSEKCSIPLECLQMMYPHHPPRDSGYNATHQLLYYVISDLESVSCSTQMNAALHPMQTNTLNMSQHLCSRLFAEAKMIFKSGRLEDTELNYLSAPLRDVFIESILLCISLNFDEFFQIAWLNKLLEWSNNEYGCFGAHPEFGQFQRFRSRRKLLNDLQMIGDCSCHTSGLGFGVFARFFQTFLTKFKPAILNCYSW
ncbi:UPF0764 protein C16orf89 homolog [Tubulanus polymorphus]|uniref:UPF0764 protein C16orf89 homolog n=1 Tax=Tubulanus polymorphus TaxID=672921 RepID=UPI003DA323AA